MAEKDAQGRWIDAAGFPVPQKYVDPVDKKRDALVEREYKNALAAQKQLAKFKAGVLSGISVYLDWLAKRNGEETLNPGGNYILTGFSGNKRIQIKINKVLEFDERLQLAKQKIDKCLEKWSDDGNENLKVVVFDVFKVDQKGQVDTRRILSLRKLKIKDDLWKQAMELIADAVLVTGTRSYLLFQSKPDPDAEWETLRLDLAGV